MLQEQVLLCAGSDEVPRTDNKVSDIDRVPDTDIGTDTGFDTELNTDSVLVREPCSASQAKLVG
jgi:hypothetical protein